MISSEKYSTIKSVNSLTQESCNKQVSAPPSPSNLYCLFDFEIIACIHSKKRMKRTDQVYKESMAIAACFSKSDLALFGF